METEKFTSKEINDMANEAMENGECTDLMGNPMGEDELVAIPTEKEGFKFFTDVVLPMVKTLEGKILTITDASFEDKHRVKFVKDLMKDAFSLSASNMMDFACMMKDANEANLCKDDDSTKIVGDRVFTE